MKTSKKRALLYLRHPNGDRYNAFVKGLQNIGYSVTSISFMPNESDIFVTWNRFPNIESIAQSFEKVGAIVIVTENPWIKPSTGLKRGGMLSLSVGHHSGAGWWLVDSPDRWDSFGIEISPWRTQGERVLVLPQRGYGESGVTMPGSWTRNITVRIAQFSNRPITVRPHPGIYRPKNPDFSKTWCAVTWASGAGIKALAAGIPVFYELKNWIGALAATYGVRDIERPWMGDRLPMFQRLAWAQWYLDEIETGEPFTRCLQAKHFGYR